MAAIEPLRAERALTAQHDTESDTNARPADTVADDLDTRLLAKIAADRDRAAMRQIYERYQLRLRSFLRRLTQDDALIDETYNDVMLKVWQKAGQFRADAKVSSWIFSIGYRLCLRVLKKERSKRSLLDRLRWEPPPAAAEPEDLLEDRELIAQALATLSANHRMVIELAYFEGYSTEEIGRIAHCPQGTVKTRLHHARVRIRHALDRYARDADPSRLVSP